MSDLRETDPLLAAPPDTHRVGRRILVYTAVDSTNLQALRVGGDGTVVAADEQTAGRGRHGNQWHSAPGLGLWFSTVLEPMPRGAVFAAALAVRDAFLPGVSLQVKWPNDLLLNNRKVCGILAEERNARGVLGIGINVHHRPEDFPPELRGRAGSIAAETGSAWARSDILRDVLTRLDARIGQLARGGYEAVRSEWARAIAMEGQHIRRGDVVGRVVAIDAMGALIVHTAQGPRRFLGGEVDVVDGS
jgi:BirA family biotin operon repressor/biotin-[acetyl-CoA-carboxylase] ligase